MKYYFFCGGLFSVQEKAQPETINSKSNYFRRFWRFRRFCVLDLQKQCRSKKRERQILPSLLWPRQNSGETLIHFFPTNLLFDIVYAEIWACMVSILKVGACVVSKSESIKGKYT